MMYWDFGPAWIWMTLLMGTFYALVLLVIVLAVHSGTDPQKGTRHQDDE